MHIYVRMYVCIWASQEVLVVKNLPAKAGNVRDAGLIPGLEDPLEKGMATHSSILGLASLVAQLVKKPPAVRETWVQSMG